MSTQLKNFIELPVTVDEAKQRLRIETIDDDDMLLSLIQSACLAVSNSTSRAIAQASYELKLDSFPEHEIKLLWPVGVSVTTIQYVDPNGDWQTLPADQAALDVREDETWLLPALGTGWPATANAAGGVRITYVAGWGAAAPEPVRNYVLLHVGHFYKNRELTTGKPQQEIAFARGLIAPYRLLEV